MSYSQQSNVWHQVNPLKLCTLIGLLCLPSLGCGQATAEPAGGRLTSQAFHLSGTWSSTSNTPAYFHTGATATLLGNGKVLATGSGEELYNPSSGTWSNTGSLTDDNRSDATATLLSNGKVLVAGGSNSSGVLATAELYDPSAGTWSSTGSFDYYARAGHTATLLGNGKVLITGGYDSSFTYVQTAELYDPTAGTWSQAPTLSTPRGYHTATLLSNGKVLVVGGLDDFSQFVASAELYDPSTNSWSSASPICVWPCQGLFGHTATLLGNGKVLVTGGFDSSGYTTSAHLYDPTTDSWSTAGSPNYTRAYHEATLLGNGKVLVAGGWTDDISVPSGYLMEAELYDPSTDTFTATGSMAADRSFFTLTVLSSGKVLAVGGYGSSGDDWTSEVYDP
jgi:N-acetylneuraminic acid mutarotase